MNHSSHHVDFKSESQERLYVMNAQLMSYSRVKSFFLQDQETKKRREGEVHGQKVLEDLAEKLGRKSYPN